MIGHNRQLPPLSMIASPAFKHLEEYDDAVVTHSAPSSPRPTGRGPRGASRVLREVHQVVSVERDGDYVQLNQYHLRDAIGAGSYGIVRLAHNQEDNVDYAMKILNKKKIRRRSGMFIRDRLAPRRKLSGSAPPADPMQRVYREIATLRKLDHPNVVRLIEVLDDPVDENLCLVFELMHRGPVLEVPTENPLCVTTARRYFRDVVLGIEYLHCQKVIHRDIKPSNLLLSDCDHVKIADFGVCNEFTGPDALLTGTTGTPAFLPPEALSTERLRYSGRAADVWSMGVTLYALVTGVLPFSGDSVVTVYQRILNQTLTFPPTNHSACSAAATNQNAGSDDSTNQSVDTAESTNQNTPNGVSDNQEASTADTAVTCDCELPASLRNIIADMLRRDPQQRLTVPEIKQHAWLSDEGRAPLPSECQNCGPAPLQVSEEELRACVRRVTSVSAIILVRAMIKQRSFTHPFRAPLDSRAASRASRQFSTRCNSVPCELPTLARDGQSKALSPLTESPGGDF